MTTGGGGSARLISATRADFPALRQLAGGKPPVYFDNACTALVPRQVIEALTRYYGEFPACGGGRSRYWFAREVNDRIEGDPQKGVRGSRQTISSFINARSEKEIIFAQNTSHAINMVALGLKFRPGDAVLLTDKEHNSNLLPWLRLQKMGVIRVEQLEPGPDSSFDLDRFESRLKDGGVALASMAYTTNTTGYTIPAREMIAVAHRHGVRVLLDAAQAAPHRTIDVQALDVDYLAFSIHKMCGPRGVGVLYVRSELLGQRQHEEDDAGDVLNPAMLGGGTVSDTSYDSYELLLPPERFEVGVQDYGGQIGAGAAVEYLQSLGMPAIGAQVERLNSYLTEHLLTRYGDRGWFKILGPPEANKRGGILTFEVKRPNAVGIAEDLNQKNNVMIRDGVFCVHSYFNGAFGRGWLRPMLPSEHRMIYRVSLYFYNNLEECQVFLETLHNVFAERSYL